MRGTKGDSIHCGCGVVLMWVAVIIAGVLMVGGLVGWVMTIYSSVVNYNALLK